MPDILSAQRDFSAGELDAEMKRRDDLPIYKSGGRQMRDWRILNSGILEQRPGRRALYLQSGRIDQIQVSPNLTYDLCFGADGTLAVRDSSGAVVASQPGFYPWRANTVRDIVWTKLSIGASQTDVVVCFPGLHPIVVGFDGTNWSFNLFAFALDSGGNALPPFFRVAAPGATMQPNATLAAGVAGTIAFSADVLVTGGAHDGTIFRFAGRRMRIDSVTDHRNANVTALDALLRTQELTLAAPDGAVDSGISGYSLGQVVQGTLSSAEGEVVGINIGTNKIAVQITNYASGFLASAAGPPAITELVIGPNARSKVTAVADIAPLPAVSWDEQMVSNARGWPQSCATDDSRLIFCDLPGTPSAVAWSRTGSPYDFTVGANATDAIVELIAGKPRVYHVAPWLDELIFTNLGIYFVPINTTNPLRPGSVQFKFISPEVSSSVKPLFTSDGYLYVNEGRNAVKAIVPDGSSFSTRPYSVNDITQYHRHLFEAGPIALALSTGDGDKPERYVYVVNADGSVVVGKYETAKQWVGWLPWPAPIGGAVGWVSALHSAVRFVSVYPVQGVTDGVAVGEILDSTEYLDGAILINSPPAGMTTPGKGPFYWIRLGQVDLMDGVHPLGTHAIDANGNIVPAYQGEDLSSATITGGLAFEPFFEPYIPGGQPGQDQNQRTIRRNLGRIAVSVKNSTGLVLASLYSGPDGPNLPAQGTIQKIRRIPPWNQGDNQALAPTLRETTYRQRFSGRAFDQRVAAYKDKPGPLQIIEFAAEASA